MTAYAENVLAGLYRGADRDGNPVGGAMFYIEKACTVGRWRQPSASLPVGLAGHGEHGPGQFHRRGLRDVFRLPPLFTGLVVAALISVAIAGGIGRVGKVTEKIVPFMAFAYTGGAVLIVGLNIGRLPGVLALILREAFSLRAGLGGAAGYGIARALTVGVARGVSSNEAGLGSSVMANSAAGCAPVEQGCGASWRWRWTLCSCAPSPPLPSCAAGYMTLKPTRRPAVRRNNCPTARPSRRTPSALPSARLAACFWR